jgi:hypothetical protein
VTDPTHWLMVPVLFVIVGGLWHLARQEAK